MRPAEHTGLGNGLQLSDFSLLAADVVGFSKLAGSDEERATEVESKEAEALAPTEVHDSTLLLIDLDL